MERSPLCFSDSKDTEHDRITVTFACAISDRRLGYGKGLPMEKEETLKPTSRCAHHRLLSATVC